MKNSFFTLRVLLLIAGFGSSFASAEIPKGFFMGIEAGPMSHFEKGAKVQPYFGINAGYDITRWFAFGASLNQGFADYSDPSFSVLTTNVGGVFSFQTIEWLEITSSVMGGAAYVTPAPGYKPDEWGVDGRLAIGLRYYTLLAGLSIGADISYTGTYALKSERFLSALSLTPQLKYVF